MTERQSATYALRLLSTGCYSAASFDAALQDAEEECPHSHAKKRIAAARIRYGIHERSLCGIMHGSEEYQAWLAERRQVCHEIRTALADALAMQEQ